MNERIKIIGRQAGFVFIEDGVYGDRWYSSKCGMDASEFEKFAQLIIKDCIKVVDIWCDEVPCSEGYDKFTVSKLKERFGVSDAT